MLNDVTAAHGRSRHFFLALRVGFGRSVVDDLGVQRCAGRSGRLGRLAGRLDAPDEPERPETGHGEHGERLARDRRDEKGKSLR